MLQIKIIKNDNVELLNSEINNFLLRSDISVIELRVSEAGSMGLIIYETGRGGGAGDGGARYQMPQVPGPAYGPPINQPDSFWKKGGNL